MHYIIPGILVLLLSILLVLLEGVLDLPNLKKQIVEWIKNFKGIIRG